MLLQIVCLVLYGKTLSTIIGLQSSIKRINNGPIKELESLKEIH